MVWKHYSDNCFVCGDECDILSLRIITASRYKICPKCSAAVNPEHEYNQVKQIINQYQKFAQAQMDPELASPEIKIEPVDTIIQQAVNLLKKINPGYFIGVRKIVVDTGGSGAFGHVASGPKDDPTVIHLNLPKIKSEIQSKMQGASQEQMNKELIRIVAEIISHERGHVKSFNPQGGFVGGESSAESEEKSMMPQIERAQK